MGKMYTIRHKMFFECCFIATVLEYSLYAIDIVLLNQLGLQVKEVGLHTIRSVLPWYTVSGRWSLYCEVGTTLVHSSMQEDGHYT
jgi:hypothetical protein